MSVNSASNPPRPYRGLGTLARHLGGWSFPVFALTLLFGFVTMTLVVMAVPPGETGFASFAAEFRRWCFAWDGRSAVPFSRVAFMVSELLVFGLILLVLWSSPLKTAWRHHRKSLLLTTTLSLAVLAVALGVLVRAGTPPEGPPPSVHALRTSRMAPPLALTDQDGTPIDLHALRGKVVLVTAVYATCGSTCPTLLAQAKRAVTAAQSLVSPNEFADLRVLTITLDPTHDTQAVRRDQATHQGVSTPPWHLLGGPPGLVEATLTRWEIGRRFDTETRQIEHENLFILIDRGGRLAFRLNLSTERESWLTDALTTLLRESR